MLNKRIESTKREVCEMAFDESINPWRMLSSREVYENQWISLREDQVIRPDGGQGIYGVVHFKSIAVGILAVEDGHIYLVGQYRYTLQKYSWEIPEGGCSEGEDILDAAKRELEEETGLKAAKWELCGDTYLSNSVTDERAVWFLATELTQGKQRPEETEQLNIRRIPFEHALDMALTGEITDIISVLAIVHHKFRKH